MTRRDVVAVGASAGGVEALCALAGALPPDLPCAVLVVLHVPRSGLSALPHILSRCGPLPAAHAVDGQPLRAGHVHIAPPDHHLLVLDGRLRLSRGPTENGHRPAIDPLFRSVARAYGPGAVGVVLSGARDDGTSGLAAILARGGVAAVQDPEEALHASMPRSALAHNDIQHVRPVAELAELIAELAVRDVGADPLLVAETAVGVAGPLTTDEVPAALGFRLPGPPRRALRAAGSARAPVPLPGGAPAPRGRCWPGRTRGWRTRCGWCRGCWRRRPLERTDGAGGAGPGQ